MSQQHPDTATYSTTKSHDPADLDSSDDDETPPPIMDPHPYRKSLAAGRPRTPTRNPTSSSAASRSSPSPIGLHHLGIMSPFRRQFSPVLRRSPPEDHLSLSSSTPSTTRPDLDSDAESTDRDADAAQDPEEEEEEEEDGLAQDSRDVLVERLTDLARRLGAGGAQGEDSLGALHSKVDEMERVLASSSPRPSRPSSLVLQPGKGRRRDAHQQQRDSFWGPSMSASWVLKAQLADLAESARGGLGKEEGAGAEGAGVEGAAAALDGRAPLPGRSFSDLGAGRLLRPPMQSKVSSDVVEKMVSEAELLCQELSAVVQSLQDRREESDHIHALLLERAELAARRIVELEARVEDLEEDVQGSESDLSFLRLQLKSIESQYLALAPEDADPELTQSIKNWKADWTELRNKWAAKRQESRDFSSFGTPETASLMSSMYSMPRRMGESFAEDEGLGLRRAGESLPRRTGD